MSENIFEIKNLQCSYNRQDDIESVVLSIKELVIPRGQIVFFVGPSGIGKSTILETLGFMNNTIASVEELNYLGVSKKDAWSLPDKAISEFRNSEFSFIFQQNNLMPNFTAYENVMTTALFQGTSFDEARKSTRKVLEQMQLPTDDRPIFRYSGGQQQRLAFARAILPNFQVLFGDEPTGNLDSKSADNLMQVLTNIIHDKKTTAVIVSHDMHLATKYADVIVQIRKERKYPNNPNDERCFGIIDNNSLYIKQNNIWHYQKDNYTNEQLQQKLMSEF